jgi:hypothetical protein
LRRGALVVLASSFNLLLSLEAGAQEDFRRGDSNVDGTFDLSDAAYTLNSLFYPKLGFALSCLDAADVNDDELLDVSDVLLTDLDGRGGLDLAGASGRGSGSNGILAFGLVTPPRSGDENQDGVPDECEPSGPGFIRGDCNSDSEVRGVVTDAVFLLHFNFVGGLRPRCLSACDANGDGTVTGVVTDAVYILTYNFLGGPPPVAPYPDCGPGEGEEDEALGCESTSDACAEAG